MNDVKIEYAPQKGFFTELDYQFSAPDFACCHAADGEPASSAGARQRNV